MANDLDIHQDNELDVKEAKPKLKPPSMYQVVLLNDDYTPMDFVVKVLEKFFNKSSSEATRIMMHVHTHGKGICGVFTRDIAETRKLQVNKYSRGNQHPLKSDIEKV